MTMINIWSGENMQGEFERSRRNAPIYEKVTKKMSEAGYKELGIIGPRQVLIAYASSEVSGGPAHPRSLARTSAARSYKQ